jgi:hypothetical protein
MHPAVHSWEGASAQLSAACRRVAAWCMGLGEVLNVVIKVVLADLCPTALRHTVHRATRACADLLHAVLLLSVGAAAIRQ